MASSYLTTSQIARAVGVHPNTVRLYENWGFIPSTERTPSGYRRFTELHLDLMLFARAALHGQYPGKTIRRSILDLVRQAASRDLQGAYRAALQHQELVRAEKERAEQAARWLESWAQRQPESGSPDKLYIGQVAQRLDVSRDQLCNWERNGLIRVERADGNGYRLYSERDLKRLEVIRMLNQTGYSQMAILRMMIQLDRGQRTNLPRLLDTPRPDEDPVMAADRWLTTLHEQEVRASELIEHLKAILDKLPGSGSPLPENSR